MRYVDTHSFSKDEISRYHIGNFKTSKSLGKKVNFFKTPLGNQNFNNFQTSVYNLGHKSFETDFNCAFT